MSILFQSNCFSPQFSRENGSSSTILFQSNFFSPQFSGEIKMEVLVKTYNPTRCLLLKKLENSITCTLKCFTASETRVTTRLHAISWLQVIPWVCLAERLTFARKKLLCVVTSENLLWKTYCEKKSKRPSGAAAVTFEKSLPHLPAYPTRCTHKHIFLK
jgi:hypothetical protein